MGTNYSREVGDKVDYVFLPSHIWGNFSSITARRLDFFLNVYYYHSQITSLASIIVKAGFLSCKCTLYSKAQMMLQKCATTYVCPP